MTVLVKNTIRGLTEENPQLGMISPIGGELNMLLFIFLTWVYYVFVKIGKTQNISPLCAQLVSVRSGLTAHINFYIHTKNKGSSKDALKMGIQTYNHH